MMTMMKKKSPASSVQVLPAPSMRAAASPVRWNFCKLCMMLFRSLHTLPWRASRCGPTFCRFAMQERKCRGCKIKNRNWRVRRCRYGGSSKHCVCTRHASCSTIRVSPPRYFFFTFVVETPVCRGIHSVIFTLNLFLLAVCCTLNIFFIVTIQLTKINFRKRFLSQFPTFTFRVFKPGSPRPKANPRLYRKQYSVHANLTVLDLFADFILHYGHSLGLSTA